MYFVILFANFWIWRLFSQNGLGFLLAFFSSYLLYRATKSKNYYAFVVCLIALLFLQIRLTEPTHLTELSNDEIRVRDTRLNEYPLINLPIAYWMEAKPITVAFSRVRANFFEQLDPNLYFFANHPRERVGIEEFERFPFIFLPFFVLGIVEASKNYRFVILLSLITIIVTSFFGTWSRLGNFALFPFISLFIYLGIWPIKIKP